MFLKLFGSGSRRPARHSDAPLLGELGGAAAGGGGAAAGGGGAAAGGELARVVRPDLVKRIGRPYEGYRRSPLVVDLRGRLGILRSYLGDYRSSSEPIFIGLRPDHVPRRQYSETLKAHIFTDVLDLDGFLDVLFKVDVRGGHVDKIKNNEGEFQVEPGMIILDSDVPAFPEGSLLFLAFDEALPGVMRPVCNGVIFPPEEDGLRPEVPTVMPVGVVYGDIPDTPRWITVIQQDGLMKHLPFGEEEDQLPEPYTPMLYQIGPNGLTFVAKGERYKGKMDFLREQDLI